MCIKSVQMCTLLPYCNLAPSRLLYTLYTLYTRTNAGNPGDAVQSPPSSADTAVGSNGSSDKACKFVNGRRVGFCVGTNGGSPTAAAAAAADDITLSPETAVVVMAPAVATQRGSSFRARRMRYRCVDRPCSMYCENIYDDASHCHVLQQPSTYI